MRAGRRADALAPALAVTAAVAVALRAAWFEPRRLVTRERTLRLADWPEALDGLRVALISDLHAGAPQVQRAMLARVVRRTLRARPDLIVVLGDVVDPHVIGGTPVAPELVARMLGRLHAPLGVFAILGNHDSHNDGPRVAHALTAAGLIVLENAARAVTLRGATFHVAGIADPDRADPDLTRTLRDVPEGAPVILLSHDPDVFPRVPRRVSLTLSGHTHGGQIAIPWLRRLAAPTRFGERYLRGHVVEGGRHLFVTSGVGTSRVPLRWGLPPEIVVLVLRGARPRRPT